MLINYLCFVQIVCMCMYVCVICALFIVLYYLYLYDVLFF